ncbi:MAG: hypothetical protein RLZZ252_1648 [Bacteroidota bacterium]|jgi:hypothetical protein
MDLEEDFLNCKPTHSAKLFSPKILVLLLLLTASNFVAAMGDSRCMSTNLFLKFNDFFIENIHNYGIKRTTDGLNGAGEIFYRRQDSSELDFDTVKSQWNPIDSIKFALRTKPFITGALDGRNSFVSADPVSIFGLRYGYDWGKVAAHTGIYGSRYIEFRGNDSMLYRFRYISSTFEYKLYRTYRYSFLCFGQVGIGATSIKSKLNPVGSPDLKPMIPLELGMYGSVRLLRYFGLAAGLGTRLAVLKGGNRFSGPIYTFGITYFPSAMLEDGVKVMEKLNIKVPSVLE